MRARIVKSLINTGSAARDYIRSVCGRKQSPVRLVTENGVRERASTILESFRNHRRQRQSQDILTGQRVIKAMDEQMREVSLPFEFTAAARSQGKGIVEGSLVTILGDDRVFEVLQVWCEYESVRIRDAQEPTGVQYLLPWTMVRLARKQEDYG